jgi:hypothetical protein
MARAIAAFYNRDYRPIAQMPSRPDADSARTARVERVLDALRRGAFSDELLPDVGRLGGWSRAELRDELAKASPPRFIDCQGLSGRDAQAFGVGILANCFYRTDGDRARYWSVSFTRDGRIAYVELEQ